MDEVPGNATRYRTGLAVRRAVLG
ncbi:MAG: 4-carboxymuconolactone decarboxylase, partial [Mesorhizobium sp.]